MGPLEWKPIFNIICGKPLAKRWTTMASICGKTRALSRNRESQDIEYYPERLVFTDFCLFFSMPFYFFKTYNLKHVQSRNKRKRIFLLYNDNPKSNPNGPHVKVLFFPF